MKKGIKDGRIKYLNEAIIGNKNMIATLTSKGELQRLYFPTKTIGNISIFFIQA